MKLVCKKIRTKVRGSLVSKALNRLQSEGDEEEEMPMTMEEPEEEEAPEEMTGGLMSRRA